MSNESEVDIEEKCRKMIEAEQKVISEIPDKTLENLIALFYLSQNNILDNPKGITSILDHDIHRKYGEEALYSTFRVLKAVLAEIEYRIKEKII